VPKLGSGGKILKRKISGTDVLIFKIFSPKKLQNDWRFLTKNTAKFCIKLDHNIGF
jgi:hypothetical protein